MCSCFKQRLLNSIALSVAFAFQPIRSRSKYVKYESKYDDSCIRSKSNGVLQTRFSYFG